MARKEAKELMRKKAEEAFWAAMTPEEAERMRGMLKAIGMYQEQLKSSERTISDIQKQVAGEESAYRALRRKVQQVEHDAHVFEAQEAEAKEELARWRQRGERAAPEMAFGADAAGVAASQRQL